MKQPDPSVRAVARYQPRRRISWPMLGLIGALHVLGLYALAHLLVPDVTASIEREVIAAFDIPATPPAPPPPPAPGTDRSEPDEGAQGSPGRDAVPEAVRAPPAPLPSAAPRPRAASTGTAKTSGAREAGEGTGAAGSGDGTGSGNSGSGRGGGGAGVAVTKPVHVSGGIENARDYPVPPGGRAARRGTEVIVKVIVGVDGRARNCSVFRASPDPEADRITCQLVEQRLGFDPARDASGNPMAAPFYWRQRWF